MFGKLSWGAIPFDQPIPLFAGAFVVAVMLGVVAYVTIKGWVPYLWRNGSPASTTSGSASCM